jgi:hypothetical protein
MIFSNSVSKLVKMGFILSLFFAFLTPAYAQTLGQSCDQTVGCDENYICNSNNVCATDPNLDAAPANANGTVEPGGKCSSPDNCDDVGGQNYGCIGGFCTLDTATATGGDTSIPTPAATTPGAAATTPTPAATTPGAGATGGALVNPLAATSITDLIAKILLYVQGIGLTFLTLMLIYVGFLFVNARGNPEKVGAAKTALLWTVVGGLLLLGASAMAQAIAATAGAL